MGKKNSKSGSKKDKSKHHGKSKRSRQINNAEIESIETKEKVNLPEQQESPEKLEEEKIVGETLTKDNAEKNQSDNTQIDQNILEDSDLNKSDGSNINGNISENTDSNANNSKSNSTSENDETNSNEWKSETCNNSSDTNECYEEMKARQQEILNNLKSLGEALVAMTLTRDSINSLRVNPLTELYFRLQVRPLLDAMNIISFASSNMSIVAQNIQINTFGDRKEIRDALKLSYKMNDELEDIINALDRRLEIFIRQINNMDRNCPPFDSGKDS